MQAPSHWDESGLGGDIAGYRPLCRIGSGAMAEAILAVDSGLSRPVVLKRLTTTNEAVTSHFRNEAELSVRLTHPHVVAARALVEHEGSLVLVLEYVDGQELCDLRKAHAHPDYQAAVCEVLLQLLGALDYVHTLSGDEGESLNIVHRDVKPTNIIITPDGDLKLLDFGVAKSIGSEETQERCVKGTLRYVSPEYVAGGDVTPAIDLWAVGIIAWEFLALRRVFDAKGPAQIIAAVAKAEIPSLGEVSDVSPAIVALVDRALSRDAGQRFQTAEAFRQALLQAAPDLRVGGALKRVMATFGEDAARRKTNIRALRDSAFPDAPESGSGSPLRSGIRRTNPRIQSAAPPPAPRRRLLPFALVLCGIAVASYFAASAFTDPPEEVTAAGPTVSPASQVPRPAEMETEAAGAMELGTTEAGTNEAGTMEAAPASPRAAAPVVTVPTPAEVRRPRMRARPRRASTANAAAAMAPRSTVEAPMAEVPVRPAVAMTPAAAVNTAPPRPRPARMASPRRPRPTTPARTRPEEDVPVWLP